MARGTAACNRFLTVDGGIHLAGSGVVGDHGGNRFRPDSGGRAGMVCLRLACANQNYRIVSMEATLGPDRHCPRTRRGNRRAIDASHHWPRPALAQPALRALPGAHQQDRDGDPAQRGGRRGGAPGRVHGDLVARGQFRRAQGQTTGMDHLHGAPPRHRPLPQDPPPRRRQREAAPGRRERQRQHPRRGEPGASPTPAAARMPRPRATCARSCRT